MENIRQAGGQTFRENQGEVAAEARAPQDCVQEAESKADVESTERGEIMAEQIGMANKTIEEQAALRPEVADLKGMVKTLHAA